MEKIWLIFSMWTWPQTEPAHGILFRSMKDCHKTVQMLQTNVNYDSRQQWIGICVPESEIHLFPRFVVDPAS